MRRLVTLTVFQRSLANPSAHHVCCKAPTQVDAGETPEGALVRELREELGIDVSALCSKPQVSATSASQRVWRQQHRC